MRITNILVYFLVLSVLFSCAEDENTGDNTLFKTHNGSELGMDFSNDLNPKVGLNILEYLYYYNGGGVAVGDINQDGLEDVFLTANQKPDKLFVNKGGLKFEDITLDAGILQHSSWSTGVSIDDVNGDGFLDIYVCKVDPITPAKNYNELYINNGDGSFKEQAEAYGLNFSGYSTQASFFDYDNDGDLDMYLLNHSVHSVNSYGKISKRSQIDTLSGDRLYENRLNEQEQMFVDVTKSAGIYSSPLGYGLAVVTADINEDGFMDIYVGNDFHENDYLYINSGKKSFIESIAEYTNHTSKFTMGADVSDINGDGMSDIFTTDMLPFDAKIALKSGGEDTDQVFDIRTDFGYQDQYARNHFQIQNKNGKFQDIALQTNTYASDWSWSVLLQDFDNNGHKDIFITNGIVKRPNDLDYINYLNRQEVITRQTVIQQQQLNDLLKIMPEQELRNILFLQDEKMSFSKLADSFIGEKGLSNGSAYADLDRDGDLDLIVNNVNESVSILENSASQNYISITLIDQSNKTIKGAKVFVYADDQMWRTDAITTRGYQSSSTHKLHFGLAQISSLDSVMVVWPDQTKQRIVDLDINNHHIITKSEITSKSDIAAVNEGSGVVEAFGFNHVENEFLDQNHDRLIPQKLSKEGPIAVSEDFNQDGIADLFIGGARYQESALLLGNRSGGFDKKVIPDFKLDSKYEDVGAVALDFDKDGDLDLYVVSGGNDTEELNKFLEDRLYLNNGEGSLKRLPVSLPHTNGSVVAAGDFDGDGYDDIFVGSRSIPNSYGLSPISFLLRNKEGLGIEINQKGRYGMVTDAAWIDVDNDQDLDLVMCGDWMNITVLENQNDGNLVLRDKSIGLANTAGLWNALAFHDFNSDGKPDILAGNAGSNFKWTASTDKPVKLFVTDMDENGLAESIIFHDYFGRYVPFHSFDELVGKLSILKKKFKTYQEFSSVEDIKDLTDKPIVEEKHINELRSMLYLSNQTSYDAIPLPKSAQLSTIQDIIVDTIDQKVIYVGNDLQYLTKLGKSMGNSGGRLGGFDLDNLSFKSEENLGLPLGLDTRNLVHIGEQRYLVTCNNGIQYILNLDSN